MSTAGKVLIVMVLLTSLVWMVLASGVARLNTNGNARLHELTEQIAKLQTDFKQTQDEIVRYEIRLRRSKKIVDREITVLRATSVRPRKGPLSNPEMHDAGSISACDSQRNRLKGQNDAPRIEFEEQESEEQALTRAKSEVEDLKTKNGELLSELSTLRKNFESVYHSNVEFLGKTH